ncbi:hypothetical protein BKA93DRAFT_485859 [Sparassis latifolia]
MHPFGGTPICPRCNKMVYAAEQIMGPGRKLYHKPCLTCTTCGKRLDSYNLVEHDQEPYCKNCHIKNFGTRDTRLANLPNRDEVFVSSPPTLPVRGGFSPTRRVASPPPASTAPQLPVRRHVNSAPSAPPMLRPTRTFSPVRTTFSSNDPVATEETGEEDAHSEGPLTPEPASGAFPTHTGRVGGLPRTVPLTLSPSKGRNGSPVKPGDTAAGQTSPTLTRTLLPSATGTRYGVALGGRGTGAGTVSPMMTGGRGPTCGRCGKTVYFAEQVKAIGKTWHKGCLRCTECGTLLDSTRLTEREGSPFCQRCYGKLYGPQGSGYALLGKAGA